MVGQTAHVIVEPHEGLVRFVQLDEMTERRTCVAHHETLFVSSGGVENDRPSLRCAVLDGSVEAIDHERHVVHAYRRPDTTCLVLDDQFDHDIPPLSVGGRVIEFTVVSKDLASIEFDVFGDDERSGTEGRSPRLDGGRRYVVNHIGDLPGRSEY